MSDDTHELHREDWQAHLDQLTKEHHGHEVTIELLEHPFGDEIEVQALPLAYLEYDPKDDVIIVAVGGVDRRYPVVLRHIIEHPVRVLADTYDSGRRLALDVAAGDGNHTIVSIHDPADS
jgi:hypothetical protein